MENNLALSHTRFGVTSTFSSSSSPEKWPKRSPVLAGHYDYLLIVRQRPLVAAVFTTTTKEGSPDWLDWLILSYIVYLKKFTYITVTYLF